MIKKRKTFNELSLNRKETIYRTKVYFFGWLDYFAIDEKSDVSLMIANLGAHES